MRHFLLFAALAALLACASANNHVCNSGWQDLIEPSANGKTYGNPHADAMFAAAMTAGVASKGCGLLSATKYEACYSSGAFLRSRTVAGEWGFGGQLKVFCPNKNAPETWNALAVADVKGSKWELTDFEVTRA
ncbi:hypothetical protein COHA_007176 [Chlorella ohadii]|uniref:Uncharacterized protein n=1 Tax=Chlorella ohadii TaxID=2649997 RepID=A0AAD5DMD8_9CHLO|nr:hypothetical protein COHA_007176 [Chlorella ohadii]